MNEHRHLWAQLTDSCQPRNQEKLCKSVPHSYHQSVVSLGDGMERAMAKFLYDTSIAWAVLTKRRAGLKKRGCKLKKKELKSVHAHQNEL